MWCVLAHVRDGERMMREVYQMLAPGGLLFLQTPHNTIADRMSYARQGRQRRTGRPAVRPAPRRPPPDPAHDQQSITTLLERVGFVDIEVEPETRYPMSSVAYLHSLRAPSWSVRPGAWAMDKAVVEQRRAPDHARRTSPQTALVLARDRLPGVRQRLAMLVFLMPASGLKIRLLNLLGHQIHPTARIGISLVQASSGSRSPRAW